MGNSRFGIINSKSLAYEYKNINLDCNINI
jgi:hypothetical protein